MFKRFLPILFAIALGCQGRPAFAAEQSLAVTDACQQQTTNYALQVFTVATTVELSTNTLWRDAMIQNLSASYTVSFGTDSNVAAYTGAFNSNLGYQLTYNSNSVTSEATFRLVPGNQYYLISNAPQATPATVTVYLCR